MIASKSIRLYELTLEFVKDKKKAKEYIDNIEAICEGKLQEHSSEFVTKSDITELKAELSGLKDKVSESKVEIIKWTVATMIAIVSIVVALEKLL